MGDLITADVRTSEAMDCMVVTPRLGTEGYALSRALGDALPGVKVSRSAVGLQVPARGAYSLLGANGGLDLRWDAEARLFAENRHKAEIGHPQLLCEIRRITDGGKDPAATYLRDMKG